MVFEKVLVPIRLRGWDARDQLPHVFIHRCLTTLKCIAHLVRNPGRRLSHAADPLTGGMRVIFLPPQSTKKDVLFLKELIEAGRYRPVIDRTYPLEDVVEAARCVETEQKTGNVVPTIDGGGTG